MYINKRYTAYKKGKFNVMAKKIIKINPCPYCGGQAKVYAEAVRSFIFIHKYYVACMECGAATSQHDTEFLTRINGKFCVLTEKEAIKEVINNWNNRNFNTQTKVLHMSDKERTLWWIERLLSIAWHGLASNDSPEFIAGWKLREIAENRELIRLHSGINYDLGEVAKVLFNDFRVKDIIYQFFEDRGSMLF